MLTAVKTLTLCLSLKGHFNRKNMAVAALWCGKGDGKLVRVDVKMDAAKNKK